MMTLSARRLFSLAPRCSVGPGATRRSANAALMAAMRPLRLPKLGRAQVRLRVFSAAQNDKLVFYVYV